MIQFTEGYLYLRTFCPKSACPIGNMIQMPELKNYFPFSCVKYETKDF